MLVSNVVFSINQMHFYEGITLKSIEEAGDPLHVRPIALTIQETEGKEDNPGEDFDVETLPLKQIQNSSGQDSR